MHIKVIKIHKYKEGHGAVYGVNRAYLRILYGKRRGRAENGVDCDEIWMNKNYISVRGMFCFFCIGQSVEKKGG